MTSLAKLNHIKCSRELARVPIGNPLPTIIIESETKRRAALIISALLAGGEGGLRFLDLSALHVALYGSLHPKGGFVVGRFLNKRDRRVADDRGALQLPVELVASESRIIVGNEVRILAGSKVVEELADL